MSDMDPVNALMHVSCSAMHCHPHYQASLNHAGCWMSTLQAEKLRIKKQKAKAFTDNKNAGKVCVWEARTK